MGKKKKKEKKDKFFLEKAKAVSAVKTELTADVQKVLDRVMEEVAGQDPGNGDLIRKYGMRLTAKRFAYEMTDSEGGEHFGVDFLVSLRFPLVEASGTRSYNLAVKGDEDPRMDWEGASPSVVFAYLDGKLSGSAFSMSVRDVATGLLDKLRREDRSVTKGLNVKWTDPDMDAAVEAATAPGTWDGYRKTAVDTIEALYREKERECLSENAVWLRLKDVKVSFARQGKDLSVRADYRYVSSGGEKHSSRSQVILRVPSLFDIYAEDMAPVLEGHIRNAVAECSREQFNKKITPVFSEYDDPSLPRSLRECLAMHTGGKVVGYSRRLGLDKAYRSTEAPLRVAWGDGPRFAGGKPPALHVWEEIRWQEAVEADDLPYSIDGTELPRNLYEFAGFIFQARALYDGMETIPGLAEKPVVPFWFPGDLMPGQDGGTVRDRLELFFRAKMREEYDREHYEDHNLEVLDGAGLTEADLEILRSVYRDGGQSANSVARLETDPGLTQEALKAGLERLSGIEVLLPDGNMVPLLLKRTERIRKYNLTYTEYYPRYAIPEEFLSRVTPRAYTFSDIDSFIPSVRDEWRAKLMAAAAAGGSESRWEALTCFEAFPKTFQAKYIKTAEGQEFFAGFEGDDAVYAELVLSGISGGKTLAKKLYARQSED